jgi:Na+/H+-translocating membrane pyrophosphatase
MNELFASCKLNICICALSYRSCAAAFTFIIAALLSMSTIIGVIGMCRSQKNNASELAWAAADPIYYLVGAYTLVRKWLINEHND